MTSSFSLQFLMHFFLRSSCFQTSTTTTTIKNGEPCEKSLPLQELTNRQQHFTSWIYPILCFSEVSLFSIHISRLSCKQSYNWFALNHVDSNSFTTNEWREREREKEKGGVLIYWRYQLSTKSPSLLVDSKSLKAFAWFCLGFAFGHVAPTW